MVLFDIFLYFLLPIYKYLQLYINLMVDINKTALVLLYENV